MASAVMLVVPRVAIVGTLLLGGAIATHLQHQQGIVFPAAIEAAVSLRLPELTMRLGASR